MSQQVVNIVPNDLANAVLPTAMQIGVWQLYVLCKLAGMVHLLFDLFFYIFFCRKYTSLNIIYNNIMHLINDKLAS